MALESANVETLQAWLADGGVVRSEHMSAATLAEKLAVVVFDGDSGWPSSAEVDAYRDALRDWFAGDSGGEAQFVALTAPDAAPGALVDWFLPVVLAWEKRGAPEKGSAQDKDDGAAQGGGFGNPSFDGTPGTEFYRQDAATGEYLYSEREQGGDWASYEKRRYSEPAQDENYHLDYRFDRRDKVYEWYDEAGKAWRDQTWADLAAAARHTASPEAPGAGPAAEWDENWGMFYRVGPGGVYEFADAVAPGDQSSGCGTVWLSHEQILARDTRKGTAGPDGEAAEAARAAARTAVEAALESAPGLRGVLDAGDITDVIKELAQEMLGGHS
jgi:hypothetical protein